MLGPNSTIFRPPLETGWRNSNARLHNLDERLLLRSLFHSDSYWRDALALSWSIQTINGADAILKRVDSPAPSSPPRRGLANRS